VYNLIYSNIEQFKVIHLKMNKYVNTTLVIRQGWVVVKPTISTNKHISFLPLKIPDAATCCHTHSTDLCAALLFHIA
ncbi:MAG: hypothetical protein ACRC7H_05725, partial [Plesiomonas shigelloides]